MAQSYTSYFTGDAADVQTSTVEGTVLMGGATENDNAMRWFLERAGGGDVLVLRASGSNGYNNYLYSELGVAVNSVETIVCNDATASEDPYVIQQLYNAEALWFAGGDQWKYFSYWNNTSVEQAINYLINVKKIPVGGTSAGMAILGHIVFTAQYGSVTSATALSNPYAAGVTLSRDEFILNRWLNNTITDTHYDNPDRRGRQVSFMARQIKDYNTPVFGIACEEYTAVCIDGNGKARVFGDYPSDNDYAYFLQTNCTVPFDAERCNQNASLTWSRGQKAVRVYKVPGTSTGDYSFELSNWATGTGGSWQNWSAVNGVLQVIENMPAPTCTVSTPNNNALSFCPPLANGIVLVADTTGSSYQWQVNTGSGFTDLENNSLYYGAHTNTLSINNVPTGYYGYQYRCIVNSIAGKTTEIQFASTWVGAINNEWANAANWQCSSLPDENTDVHASGNSQIILQSNAACRSLQLKNNASLTVTNGFHLIITH